ncbi:hypothetical protein COL154_008896 [Colletotrichum chrysophilum]|uniref:uncharacterized protein n=1 Tax=Colletotrichum chrysophilum TaxID=1836956 RepID=UPI002301918A|nr:uncharacterized protein COL26b_012575 [Colletotrichum chrysophilum]KAJ0343864.1 hypothetical protein KNSL1_009907 [Colletotrichum chrysophilum]KAJ0358735.1 hypothetical protein COL154_008896 [Colletotrichum chrysophilum]KAJ0364293.1 hypothetical protein COL26b_012575 [Colletotrichum chrysophilum]
MSIKLDPDDTSRFDNLEVLTTTYKTVSGHEITTNVLIPKQLLSKPSTTPAPIILRYHGGGFIAASSMFPAFFQPWHFQLAERHSAVIVSPNYRLCPEATMEELMSDIEDHFTWVQTKLASFVQEKTGGKVAVDISRILTAGDSAGGYMSLMAGLLHPDKIRACTAAYPGIDLKDPHFLEGSKGPTLGVGPLPYSIVEDHMKKIREGTIPAIISDDSRFERGGLMFGLTHHGLTKHLLDIEKRQLFPFDKIDDGARFPRGGVFVWHGQDDTVVPATGSISLKEKLEKLDPELEFHLTLRPGEHGFDHESKIEEPWMAEGLSKVVKSWLQ